MYGPTDVLPEELQQIMRGFPYHAQVQIIVGREGIDADGHGTGKCQVLIPGIPFEILMPLAEFAMHRVAQESGAGYEKALELLVKGAMTYKGRRIAQ